MEDLKLQLKNLQNKKDELEGSISAFNSAALWETGMLVDAEGFPRTDIDVYSVRLARSKVNELKNDLKSVMDEIEKLLHQLHAISDHPVQSTHKSEEKRPFLRVNQVFESSPAQECGLCIGDLILSFGSMTQSTYSSEELKRIVSNSIGKRLDVQVMRNPDGHVLLHLIPKVWNGEGVLGCHISPLNV